MSKTSDGYLIACVSYLTEVAFRTLLMPYRIGVVSAQLFVALPWTQGRKANRSR